MFWANTSRILGIPRERKLHGGLGASRGGELRDTKLQPFTPYKHIRPEPFVATAPGINVSESLAYDFSRGEIMAIKNQFIPSLPDVPKKYEQHIDRDSSRQGIWQVNLPRSSETII